MTDLEDINEIRVEASEKALDISKSLCDHFPDEDESPGESGYRQLLLRREEARLNGESDESSVDPPESDASIEDIEDDPAARSASDRSFRRMVAREEAARLND